MERKNTILLLIASALIIVNLVLFNWNPGTVRLNYEADMFAVSDTTAITAIQIESNEWVNTFQRDEGWKINGTYPIDPNLKNILFAVLQRVRVARSAEAVEFPDESIRVRIMGDGISELTYSVVGNATKTRTYFIDSENRKYEVEIPGYRDYVGGIFELTPNQWRDRVVFNGNWRTIQQLRIDYLYDPKTSFKIQFQTDFFTVSGLDQIDSTSVVDYLNSFEYLMANERIERGQVEALDSLSQTNPIAQLTIEDIKSAEPTIIYIFPPLTGQSYQLVTDNLGEMMIFDSNRLAAMLKQRQDLAY